MALGPQQGGSQGGLDQLLEEASSTRVSFVPGVDSQSGWCMLWLEACMLCIVRNEFGRVHRLMQMVRELRMFCQRVLFCLLRTGFPVSRRAFSATSEQPADGRTDVRRKALCPLTARCLHQNGLLAKRSVRST